MTTTTHKFQIGDYVAHKASLEQLQVVDHRDGWPVCFMVANQITYRSLDSSGQEHIELAYGLRSGQEADSTTRAFEFELLPWAEVVAASNERRLAALNEWLETKAKMKAKQEEPQS